MATKKIRVYELARELGVENAVVLDLANELKIGVKSHSSSIDDPSADRVRRLADSKGLKREAPVEEPEPEEKAPAPEKAPAAKKAQAAKKSPAPAAEPAEPEAAPPPHRVVRSTGGLPEPAPPAPRPAPAREPAPGDRPREDVAPAAAADGAPATPTAPPPPRSPSGRPIPPPPGGRPIPPPPGARPLTPSGPPRSGAPRTGGAPSGAPRGGPGGGRGGGFPRGGPGGPPGGPPGGRGGCQGRGRPGPQGQRPRRKKRRRRNFEDLGPAEHPQLTPADAPVPEGEIVVQRGITIQELAPKLNRTSADLVRVLFDAGEMVTGTQSLADEMIELSGETLGAEVLMVEPGQEEELELRALLGDDEEEEEDESLLEPRAPVVTVMGHVDHGKTTLLDRIREAHVVDSEAGGITQHIGAYQVVKNDRQITFIDTPGHEAFTAMRARGAQATDIAVLFVAAADGVMPQTVEAISHAKAAEVPVVVAVTKVDKPDADPQRVRQQLADRGLVPVEWGGEYEFVDVSAKTGQNLDHLLETILLVADLQELKADPDGPVRGIALEAHLDKGRGPIATVLVQRGTLRVGDAVVCGAAWAKVRAMFDEWGNPVTEAGPAKPVQVLGWSHVPAAGDEIRSVTDEREARHQGQERESRQRAADLVATRPASSLADLLVRAREGELPVLNLVIKADVQGSLEAIVDALEKFPQDEVRI